MDKLLIKNGIVIDPLTKTEVKRDIYIENGIIKDLPLKSRQALRAELKPYPPTV
jgi:hypothetical protein